MALRTVIAQIGKVVPTESTVMIFGETGTGKELIASAIHKRSKRSAKAFIRVNCAAIPTSSIASDSSATRKAPLPERFSDELVASNRPMVELFFWTRSANFRPRRRLLCCECSRNENSSGSGAANRFPSTRECLRQRTATWKLPWLRGTFRQDLFSRLNVFPIRVPSLRERKDDIPLLVEYLVERYAKRAGKRISHVKKKTLDLFQAYDWPGNIRELQNVVERAVILCDGETFSVEETWLPRKSNQLSGGPVPRAGVLAEDKKEFAEPRTKSNRGRIGGMPGSSFRPGWRGRKARNSPPDP